MTKIDEATGLIELPEGFYWHVKRGSLRDYSYITVRKDSALFGLIPIHSEYLSMICYSHEVNTPERLKQQVRIAWSIRGDGFLKRITPAGESFNPYGSYPPKSL